ncbi:MAG: vWA domain-containing protein [Candidatus Latescibacterota bacterium]|jgi:hypothetical protein
MGVLLPLFIAGSALLVVPFLIHRIRRPERQVQHFSSLLFVPEIKREVIERRSVEHVPLMLLRMLLLLLLTAAFARPYIEQLQAAIVREPSAAFHVVALDISASMATEGVMLAAVTKAQSLVDSLPVGERICVLLFAEKGEVVAPFYGDVEAGSALRASQALAGAKAGWQATDYTAVLQDAEALLAAVGNADARRVVHLFSDFQESAMSGASAWRLASTIELNPVYVGRETPENLAVQDAIVRRSATGEWQVRARVKNWSSLADQRAEVALVVAGERVAVQERILAATSASQFTFSVPAVAGLGISGYIELGEDALARDNRFYFAWNPSPLEKVLLLKGTGPRSYDRLLQAAFVGEMPFVLERVDRSELTLPFNDVRVLVADGLYGLGTDEQRALRSFVEMGGRLFLPLDRESETEPLNRLLAGSSLTVGEMRFAHEDKAVFTRVEWIDLQHDLFRAFRGPRFNDFSSLRFFNYRHLSAGSSVSVLARFTNGDPAIVEVPLGKGRVLVWAGGMDLRWSTLARDPRFVPLMHEALRYLVSAPVIKDHYLVGERIKPIGARGAGQWLEGDLRGERAHAAITSGTAYASMPGLLRWRPEQDGSGYRVQAVNLRGQESDPTRVPAAEWAIRLGDAPLVYSEEAVRDDMLRREFGYYFLVALLLFLLVESAYTFYLRRLQKVV